MPLSEAPCVLTLGQGQRRGRRAATWCRQRPISRQHAQSVRRWRFLPARLSTHCRRDWRQRNAFRIQMPSGLLSNHESAGRASSPRHLTSPGGCSFQERSRAVAAGGLADDRVVGSSADGFAVLERRTWPTFRTSPGSSEPISSAGNSKISSPMRRTMV